MARVWVVFVAIVWLALVSGPVQAMDWAEPDCGLVNWELCGAWTPYHDAGGDMHVTARSLSYNNGSISDCRVLGEVRQETYFYSMFECLEENIWGDRWTGYYRTFVPPATNGELTLVIVGVRRAECLPAVIPGEVDYWSTVPEECAEARWLYGRDTCLDIGRSQEQERRKRTGQQRGFRSSAPLSRTQQFWGCRLDP